jgi:hypothetical protein
MDDIQLDMSKKAKEHSDLVQMNKQMAREAKDKDKEIHDQSKQLLHQQRELEQMAQQIQLLKKEGDRPFSSGSGLGSASGDYVEVNTKPNQPPVIIPVLDFGKLQGAGQQQHQSQHQA